MQGGAVGHLPCPNYVGFAALHREASSFVEVVEGLAAWEALDLHTPEILHMQSWHTLFVHVLYTFSGTFLVEAKMGYTQSLCVSHTLQHTHSLYVFSSASLM